MAGELTVKQSRFADCDFRSQGEKDTALGLEADRQSGKIKAWQFEKHIPLVVEGKTICEIWPDYLIEYPNGRQQVIEVKGGQIMKSKWWALKRELFKALFPHIEYTVKDTFFKRQKRKLKSWDGFKKKWVPKITQL